MDLYNNLMTSPYDRTGYSLSHSPPAFRNPCNLRAAQVEAKYGNSFFDAEVVEVAEDGKVKIKWGILAHMFLELL